MSRPQRVELKPRLWVRLPGVDVEIMLHGKWCDNRTTGVTITRTGAGEVCGGWDLRPVAGRAYTRRAGT